MSTIGGKNSEASTKLTNSDNIDQHWPRVSLSSNIESSTWREATARSMMSTTSTRLGCQPMGYAACQAPSTTTLAGFASRGQRPKQTRSHNISMELTSNAPQCRRGSEFEGRPPARSHRLQGPESTFRRYHDAAVVGVDGWDDHQLALGDDAEEDIPSPPLSRNHAPTVSAFPEVQHST
ncbi:uncharacterized protein K452DRAFT_321546 [Aplosporella prunicola CBS 121167]|uniref:Uncharacterized protein n=1 Tax=Aplosporella prunicola CBS 121167 TaxID=1176127 RepID=A0A6A6B590_9PEZI|nr:uncharacterized protein K452DRAFT_321546 [Aplosporella prunicola CBS 121167]KAF2137921.1 hypothetical protein K452DRAFT_321546 [Aplosporella prunicola CBS 121167]